MFGALNRLIGRQARKPDARLLALTLNNMTQGVVLFDTSGRLIVSNEQYRTMYGLSPDIVKPGAALIDIIRNRISSGSLGRDAQEYCEEIMSQIAAGKTVSFINETPDGRAISVVNRPIPGSDYWVGPRRHYGTPIGRTQKCAARRAGGAPRGSKKQSPDSTRASMAS